MYDLMREALMQGDSNVPKLQHSCNLAMSLECLCVVRWCEADTHGEMYDLLCEALMQGCSDLPALQHFCNLATSVSVSVWCVGVRQEARSLERCIICARR